MTMGFSQPVYTSGFGRMCKICNTTLDVGQVFTVRIPEYVPCNNCGADVSLAHQMNGDREVPLVYGMNMQRDKLGRVWHVFTLDEAMGYLPCPGCGTRINKVLIECLGTCSIGGVSISGIQNSTINFGIVDTSVRDTQNKWQRKGPLWAFFA